MIKIRQIKLSSTQIIFMLDLILRKCFYCILGLIISLAHYIEIFIVQMLDRLFIA